MLILAGLGNPGNDYKDHRHNIGFMAADSIAEHWSFGPEKPKHQALIRQGLIPTVTGDLPCILVKPQTFMNKSGQSLAAVLHFFKKTPSDLVVFYDELDLAPGRFRMKTGGGAAGHNGVRSLVDHMGPDFRRGRMGIGHPGHRDAVLSYVLGNFHKSEREWVETLCRAMAKALPLLALGEDERFQTEVMRLAPAEKSDPKKTPSKKIVDP